MIAFFTNLIYDLIANRKTKARPKGVSFLNMNSMPSENQDFFQKNQAKIPFITLTFFIVGTIFAGLNFYIFNRMEPLKNSLESLNSQVLAAVNINNDQDKQDKRMEDQVILMQQELASMEATHKDIGEKERVITEQINALYLKLIK
jgi:hypothetical protein